MHEPAESVLHGDFVLLRAGRLRLLLPQRAEGDAAGRRIVALSERMTLLPACPPGRFVLTVLGGDHADIAWAWDELRVLIGVDLAAVRLPAALVAPNTPVDHFVELEGELAFPCSSARLAGFALATGVLR